MVVGWVDTSSSVTSVVDDNTNIYRLAGTTSGNGATQAIYYARNIVLPTNNTPTITVQFNQPAAFPDVRILEYSGFSATSPLDNWTGATGNSAAADSGAAVTSTSSLILGEARPGRTSPRQELVLPSDRSPARSVTSWKTPMDWWPQAATIRPRPCRAATG